MTEPCPPDARLQRLLAGEPDGAEDAELERHLEECGRCQAELDRLTADVGGLARRFRPPPLAAPLPEAGETFVRQLKADTTVLSSPDWTTPALADEPPDAAPPSALPVVAGYEVLHEVGRGSMGVIYKARHLALQRLVALKMLRAGVHAGPEELARFRTEAEAVACLQHPNILRVYDCGVADGRPYLALEFVDGGSLKERLDGTPWPARPAARLLEAVARAVDAAHQQGIVHRDLKPSNILLAGQDRGPADAGAEKGEQDCLPYEPKVADFGLAKNLAGAAGAHQTQSGAVLGTPAYMAPEQAAGGEPVGPATVVLPYSGQSLPKPAPARPPPVGPAADVYGLGAVLYELLTGRPPFTAETSLAVLLQVRYDEPVAVTRLRPTVPHDLATITHQCLQKEPGKRYASAVALADDLRRFLDGQPIGARPVGVWKRLVQWVRRHPLLALWSAVALVGTGLGLGLATGPWRPAVANAAGSYTSQPKEMSPPDVQLVYLFLRSRNWA
jgi:serine/threonine protein kinase